MSIFHLSTPAHHTLQPPLFKLNESHNENFTSEYIDPVLSRLCSIMLRKFQVRDVYLSLPGIPLKELVAMGISPSPQKEALIEALVFARSQKTLSNQNIIVVEDAFTDVLLRNHPVTTSDSPSLRFLAAANVTMKEKVIGHLCILDSVPHFQFSPFMQALLCEFADTIADIWTERQALYRELRRDGVHMQQTVVGVLRPPLTRLLDDAQQIRQSFHEVPTSSTTTNQISASSDVLATLETHILHFQRNISYFEYMVSCAIQVVSQAKEHHGMSCSVKFPTTMKMQNEANKTMKPPIKQTNEADAKYTYDWVLDIWNKSMEELIHNFRQLSLPVQCHTSSNVTSILRGNNSNINNMEDCSFSFASRNSHTLTVANICKLTAHPDVLFFCIAALVGHFYCCDCHETVHIGMSMKPLKTRMPPTLQKAASFNSELLAVSTSASSPMTDMDGFEATFTAGTRFASTSTNRFKLCIRIGVSGNHTHPQLKHRSIKGNHSMSHSHPSDVSAPAFRMLALAKDKRESIDVLTRQYLQGDCRQITDRAFQIIVPVLLTQPPPPPVVFARSPCERDSNKGEGTMEYVPPQLSPTIKSASNGNQWTIKLNFHRFLHFFRASPSSPSSLNEIVNNQRRCKTNTSSSTVVATTNEEDNDVDNILDMDDFSDADSRDLEEKLFQVTANVDASGSETQFPLVLKPQPFSYDEHDDHARRKKSHGRSSSSMWGSFVDYFFSHSSSPHYTDRQLHSSVNRHNQSKIKNSDALQRQSSISASFSFSFSSAVSAWTSLGSRSGYSSNNSSVYRRQGSNSWLQPISSSLHSTPIRPIRVTPSDNVNFGD